MAFMCHAEDTSTDSHICNKIVKNFGILTKIRCHWNFNTLKQIYYRPTSDVTPTEKELLAAMNRMCAAYKYITICTAP